MFLFKRALAEELGEDYPGRSVALRAKRPARLPTVLSAAEVAAVIAAMPSRSTRLLAGLLYGTGMRVLSRPAIAVTSPLDRIGAHGEA